MFRRSLLKGVAAGAAGTAAMPQLPPTAPKRVVAAREHHDGCDGDDVDEARVKGVRRAGARRPVDCTR